jgi:large subunit ribosomal protein L20
LARVKRGVTKHRRHKKILALAKGYQASSGKQYKRAKEALVHAWSHAYRHRRERKRDFRSLWILRIGAAARTRGITYSQFMHGLKTANVEIDRKMLADLAVRDADAFTQLVNLAQTSLSNGLLPGVPAGAAS